MKAKYNWIVFGDRMLLIPERNANLMEGIEKMLVYKPKKTWELYVK